MDSLNNYCIRHICQYLDLQGQINMAVASPDFLHELEPLWQKLYKIVELNAIIMKANSDILIQSIQGTVKKLILRCHIVLPNEDELKVILSEVNFPNVNAVNMEFFDDSVRFDYLIQLVVSSCPNLTELCLAGFFTGKYVSQLEKLEHISIIYQPSVFQERHIEEIFKNLKLKKVSLSKCVNWEDWEYTEINSDDLFNNLLKCGTIEELYLDTEFLQQRFLDQIIVNLKQLRKLAFIGWLVVPIKGINGNICGLVKGVVVDGHWIEEEEEEFITLMSRLKNLELVSFSDANINLEFLRRLIQARLNSNKQLNIYCPNTQVTDADLRLLSNISNVNFSSTAYKYDCFERSDFDILLKID